MHYRKKGTLESLAWRLLSGLRWVGVIGIAWNLFRPGGWLFRIMDLIVHNQPSSYYYLAVSVLGLIATKVWLDNIGPRALYNLSTVTWACAGTFFVLSLLLPL